MLNTEKDFPLAVKKIFFISTVIAAILLSLPFKNNCFVIQYVNILTQQNSFFGTTK